MSSRNEDRLKMAKETYYQQTVETVEKHFSTNVQQGLSAQEARARLEHDGFNEFRKTKHTSLLVKFLNQFKSFMILVLLVAAAVSGVIGYMEGHGFTDVIIILAIVVLNAVIGVAQEARAEKSLDALEKLSAPLCKVIRGGQVCTIESRELVVGDIVLLETGDSIPADLRLVEAVNLKIEEAALTGESVPAEKNTQPVEGVAQPGDQTDMAFSSTSVTYGRGKGIVTAVGMDTEVGKIASMIQSVKETKTPMQARLDKLGQILAIAALVICALIFLVGILYGRNWLEMFMTAVSLAVAAIPEGLPAVSTIVLALGVQRLVKKNAIVRKLPSVETLGSTQVICSDKTGTLTQNRMTVVQLYVDGRTTEVSSLAGELPEAMRQLVKVSLLANDATLSHNEGRWTTTGDPTETAMLDLGLKFGLNKNELDEHRPRVGEIPFDSERKMMSTAHEHDEGILVAVKGGLDETLACCNRIYADGGVRPLTDADRQSIAEANLHMAENALRVLAVAMNEVKKLPDAVEPGTLETGLVFVGMLGMIDPPREEARVAVGKCRTAGIKPVMITGDHKITATAIARQLGIMQEGDKALTGTELAALSDEELKAQIDHISVYARVAPEHKVRIVQAFQDEGKVVAMTGDGVNDAPALKLADIGVAMGITGTDVSKGAADVVLTDDNFATIVSAVEEGRRIYDNILKAIQFLLSTNMGEVLVLLVAVMMNWDAPLLPIHILWINLVTDSLPALALSVDPAAPGIMQRPPIDARRGIMTRAFSTRIVLQGLLVGALSLWAYAIGMQDDLAHARTMTFAVLAFSQMSIVFSIHAGNRSAFSGMFNNKYLIWAMLAVFAMMFIVLEVPALHGPFRVTDLDWRQWAWVAGLSLSPLLVTDAAKALAKALRRR
ncbi:calcium-translocating P-type ATPase, PMCA-type [Alistipes sp. OttesenSCG-928-L06]|nr:calcium-translocating P-type ATPase, PMCA-type [Alistipes sp. OttesenSCG-928-L06]